MLSSFSGGLIANQTDSTIMDTGNCIAVIQYHEVLYTYSMDSLENNSDLEIDTSIYPQEAAYYFKDASGDSVDHREWHISDGSTYTDKEFIHIFEEPGVYEVCLKVYYLRCVAEECVTIVIGDQPCKAELNYTPILYRTESTVQIIPDMPYAYQFRDISDGNVTSRMWFVNGDSIGTEEYQYYTFPEPGSYEVCLEIITASGCSDTQCEQIFIGDSLKCFSDFDYFPARVFMDIPEASILPAGYLYEFVDKSSPNAVDWTWKIDSDTIVQGGQYMIYGFQHPGLHTVCLTIVTDNGCVSTTCKEVNVQDPANCQADFDYYPIYYLMYPEDSAFAPWPIVYSYEFTDHSSPDAIEWTWEINQDIITGSPDFIYEFPEPGVYNACLTISTSNGCQNTTCKEIMVGNQGNCHAMFEYFRPIDSLGIELYVSDNDGLLQFVDVSSGDISKWNWDFGDGTYSSEQNPTHYFSTGSYNVCLTVYSDNGCTDTYCENIVIDSSAYCNAYFEYCSYKYYGIDSTLASDSYIIGFKNLSTPDAAHYEWDFDDNRFSNQKNPVHVYLNPGIYNVCLHISTPDGCEDTYCTTVEAGNVGCDVDFTYDIAIPDCYGFEPLYMFYTETDQNVWSYLWDFGDGETSAEIQSSHIYEQPGEYNVCLEATYDNGCVAQSCQTIYNNFNELDAYFINSCGITATEAFNSNNELSINKVYPVPSADFVTMNITSAFEQTAKIQLVNLVGETIQELDDITLNSGENEIELDLNRFGNGEYMYILTTSDKTLRGKFCIIK